MPKSNLLKLRILQISYGIKQKNTPVTRRYQRKIEIIY